MIRSKLKLLLHGEGNQSLLTFVDEAMHKELQKTILELQYSQELSLLYILQDDIDRATYYIKNGIQIFMQVIQMDLYDVYCFYYNTLSVSNLVHTYTHRRPTQTCVLSHVAPVLSLNSNSALYFSSVPVTLLFTVVGVLLFVISLV